MNRYRPRESLDEIPCHTTVRGCYVIDAVKTYHRLSFLVKEAYFVELPTPGKYLGSRVNNDSELSTTKALPWGNHVIIDARELSFSMAISLTGKGSLAHLPVAFFPTPSSSLTTRAAFDACKGEFNCASAVAASTRWESPPWGAVPTVAIVLAVAKCMGQMVQLMSVTNFHLTWLSFKMRVEIDIPSTNQKSGFRLTSFKYFNR